MHHRCLIETLPFPLHARWDPVPQVILRGIMQQSHHALPG